MANINAFTGVGVAGMSRTLHVAAAAAAAAHPAFAAPAADCGLRRCHSVAAQAPHRHRDWRVRGSGHHLAEPTTSRMATDPQSPDPWP